MKKIILIISAILLVQMLYAQKKSTVFTDTTNTNINLDEVVVSSSNFNEKIKNVAQKIEVINAKTIANTNAQNTGDLLLSTGKIFVQKSQQGGSSPVIRGFEASRVLLIIDGVRMNNAIYRSGHLQNAITLDQNSLQRVEVMYGPSSTIYGSDALGGAIHFITKGAVLASSSNFLTTGAAFARYSTVNNEKTIHADVSIANKKFGWFQGYNYSFFGDMKMGNNYLNKYPNFGRRSVYVGQINGVDSVIKNDDDRVQKFSGYEQCDITQKFLYKQNDKISHGLNLQLSNTTNVPRYDRLQDVRNFGAPIGTTLRYADWYYGPQKRLLAAYELNAIQKGFFNEVKANINFQYINESRQTREYRRYDRFDSRVEKVAVFGTTVSARNLMNNNEIVVGVDAQFNDVKSTAARTNLTTGAISKLDSRYPDGNNKMNNLALFVQHTYKFSSKKLVLNDGFRVQSIHLKSNILDNSFFKLPDTAVSQNNVAVTGNVGVVINATKNTIVKLGLSSGFRAPNIDDLAKVFESSTAAKQVVLPNANLKPEYTYNADVSIRQSIANAVTVELSAFYTLFSNAIVKAPFSLNGQDSILYNGVKSQVLASQNVNRAALYGFTATIAAQLCTGLLFTNTITYTNGQYKTDASKASSVYEKQTDGTYKLVNKNVDKKPLDHIPPVMGKSALQYSYKICSAEIGLLFNGNKYLDKYNTDGEDNAQYATIDGTPAWATVHIRATVGLTKHVQLQLAIENILDRNYRYFASGFSAPGRNYVAALRANW